MWHTESIRPTHEPAVNGPDLSVLCGELVQLLEFPMSNHHPQSRLPSTHAISPTPNPNVTKRENKSNNSLSHYSVCQQMVPISSVCVRERARHHVNVLFSIHSLLTSKALCALSPSFGLLLPLTPSLISQLCLHAHNFDTQV